MGRGAKQMNDEQDSISKNHRTILLFVAITFVAFLYFIVVYGITTDPAFEKLEKADIWYVFIGEYQTLITGFLAVGAAVFTIDQMRQSDEQANRQHKKAMDLQKRPIVEARANLKVTYHSLLQIFSAQVGNFLEDAHRYSREGDKYYEGNGVNLVFLGLKPSFEYFVPKLYEDTWEQNIDALSGRNRGYLFTLRHHLSEMMRKYQGESTTEDDGSTILHTNNVIDIEEIRSILMSLQAVDMLLRSLIDELNNIEDI